MVNTVGKKLQQARLNKQLSVEEAARVTRIRPDKLLDLEEDNYSNFPSMSYAKGFLLLYARFLGVDVREYADTLHAPNPVSSDDYEYLNAASVGPQPPPSRRPYHFSPRRERTILPVVVVCVLIVAVAVVAYVVLSFQRLGNFDDTAEKKDLSSPAASPAISTLPPASMPVAGSTPMPVARAIAVEPSPAPARQALAVDASSAPVPRDAGPVLVAVSPAPAPSTPPSTPPPAATALQTPLPAPAPPPFDPTREVRRAEPVVPTPPGHADASPDSLPPVGSGPAISSIVPVDTPPPPAPVKQLSILPIRKTMVTIRRDVAGSDPIFKDWLYPGDGPLKVSGHKFWIQVQDPGAVQITQDGQPLPAGQGDIQIE
jgi:cytoskeletal protein RodZ